MIKNNSTLTKVTLVYPTRLEFMDATQCVLDDIKSDPRLERQMLNGVEVWMNTEPEREGYERLTMAVIES